VDDGEPIRARRVLLTSLAFHPGKVGSEVSGKSFFAVTVYATAT
jgi:hypothetical protein